MPGAQRLRTEGKVISRFMVLVGAAILVLVMFAGPASATPTRLCDSFANPSCALEDTYLPETKISGALETKTLATFTYSQTVSCSTSTVSGYSTALEGSPLHVRITQSTFGGCDGGCTVEAQNLPYEAAATATGGGSGDLTFESGGGGNPRVKISGCSSGITPCTYGAASQPLKLTGGSPATLSANSVTLGFEAGSLACGWTATWSAAYLVSPKPLYLL